MKKSRVLILVTLLLLGIGFAAVATTLYINGDVNISANSEDFDVKFTKAVIDNEDKTNAAISEDGKTINYTTKELQVLNDKSVLDFEITNNSSIYDAEVSIECTSGENGEYYQITKEVASLIPSKAIENGKVEVQKIKMAIEDIEEAFTCTLTAMAKERTTKGETKPVVNKNIVNSNVECLQNKEVGSCSPGTEIRYMVNDSEEKTFYVLHDDGDALTLQQRENTISPIEWYSSNNNTNGPTTVLLSLDAATSGWVNVNTINYTMGTTIFNGNNAYTGCSSSSCTTNSYMLDSRNSKARMITIQETSALGCTGASNTCPVWMNKYLDKTEGDYGYWTMSANSSSTDYAWTVYYAGAVGYHTLMAPRIGARAVIEITKHA